MKIKIPISILLLLSFATPFIFLCSRESFALEPAEIVVIANDKVTESVNLAQYYMQVRSIPKENVLILQTTTKEKCSRTVFAQEIQQPILQFVSQRLQTQRIRCLVTMYGIPLKIFSAKKEKNDQKTDRAAVDSELALLLSGEYPLAGWQPNPYFLGFQRQKTLLIRDKVLMVSRLDGPDPESVRRIIDDSIQAEQTGLEGKACMDARWKFPQKNNTQGYALYDASLHNAAELLKKDGRLNVKLNSVEQLFSRNECPQTALYCGWYSLADYRNAFTWQPGSVGYHIASAECSTLKKSGSKVWCKRMLEEGIAATIGPVYEPYVQGFPRPDIFFSHLIDGYLSLAECYLISLPYLSWQMVLIGDPLYLPFSPKQTNIFKETSRQTP